ncbi:MAG: TonB-dependent siderophore receptor [Moraxella sp.]|nr:TonB-dependent siderophore receptor [Moraxella sp.]
MKMTSKTLHPKYLSIAIVSAMLASTAHANTADTPTTNLEDLVVTADRQGAKVKTNVVTLAEKDESTATDLRGLLEEEPAIEISGGNGTSQFLTIRGMGQNSVDIKIDNAYSDSQILYHQGRFIIDPALIKIVSVQKGAGSASAGIGATNGAIITKTVDAQDLLANSDKDYGVKLNLGYSSNDGHNYGATVFGRMGNFDALIGYSRTDEDNYKPGKGFSNPEFDNKVPYSALDKTSYLAKLGANFGNHRFVLSHMKDEHAGVRLVREEFAIDNSAGSRLTTARQSPAYRETSLSNTNLEWTAHDLSFVSALTANAYLMKNERYSADDSGCGYCGGVVGPTTTKIETRGANLNLDSEIGDNTVLKYGINYRQQEIKPHAFLSTTTQLQNPEKTDTGVYIEAINHINDFTVTAGLRYDHFDMTAMNGDKAKGSNLNPSLGVIWQATDGLSLSATHNYASRSPRLYDALMSHGRRGITTIAPNIKAEQARNTELGFNYNAGNITLDGSYYWQKIDDLVVNPQNRHDDQGNPISGVNEAINDGYAKNHGYELGASYKQNGLTARIGVSESNPKFYLQQTGTATPTAVNPEFAALVGRTWTASLAYRFDNPNVEIGWRGRLVEDVTGNTRHGAVDVTREGFNVHDVFANWKPYGNDKLNVNFAVNNVADKLYYPHSQRLNTLPGVGRDFRVGINWTY